jgi:hypothetical protein
MLCYFMNCRKYVKLLCHWFRGEKIEVQTTDNKKRPCVFIRTDNVSVVVIATSYELDDRGAGVRVPIGSRIFSSQRRPDRFWGTSSLLYNGCGGLFIRWLSDRGVKLISHIHLSGEVKNGGAVYC